MSTNKKILLSHPNTMHRSRNHESLDHSIATCHQKARLIRPAVMMSWQVRLYFQMVSFHFHHQQEFGMTLRFHLSVYHQKTIYMKMGVQSQDSEKANVRIIRGTVKFVTASKLNVWQLYRRLGPLAAAYKFSSHTTRSEKLNKRWGCKHVTCQSAITHTSLCTDQRNAAGHE